MALRCSLSVPAVVTCALLAAACSTSDATNDPPALAVIDSTRIAETDSAYVGKPVAIAVARDGAVYVSDVAEKRVIRVSGDGQQIMPVAQRGEGPGEVISPSSIALLGDSVIAVRNAGKRRVQLYDAGTSRYRGSFPLTGPTTSISGWNGSLVIGGLRIDTLAAFTLVADTVSPPTRGGTAPSIYTRLPPIAEAFGAVEVARDGDAVVGVFEAANTAYRWHLGNGAIDSVALSVTGRRGAKPEVMEQLLRDPSKAQQLAFTWSFPMLVAALPDERSAVLTFDPTMTNGVSTGPMFLQVVDWRSRRSCAEIPLPVPSEVPPRFAMRGDTLVAVVQHPDGADGVSSWIVRWRVGAGRC